MKEPQGDYITLFDYLLETDAEMSIMQVIAHEHQLSLVEGLDKLEFVKYNRKVLDEYFKDIL